MARTVAQIKQQMIDEKNAQTALAGLTSTSQTALWNLYIYLVAVAIAIFEQIMDLKKSELETIAFEAKPGTPQWVAKMVSAFQYDATNTQVAQFDLTTYTVNYPQILPQYQIITRRAVKTANNRTVTIKVAKNDPPEPLTSPELTALIDYVGEFNFAGIAYNVVSLESDKIAVFADVYYDGQYNAVIQTNVNAAITNYIANLPFNGEMSIQALTDAIQSVPGVNDVALQTVKVRPDTLAYSAGSIIYDLASGVNGVTYATVAGYMVEETTSPYTFNDTINYIAQ